MHQLKVLDIPLAQIVEAGGGLEPIYRVLGDLSLLKASISKYGLMVPPTVWRFDADPAHAIGGSGTQYVIIDGVRRITALRQLAARQKHPEQPFSTVACSICEADLETAKILSAHAHVERKQAQKASPVHEAGEVQRLLKLGKKQREIQKILHLSQATVSTLKTLSERLTTEAKQALQSGAISMTDGLELVAKTKKQVDVSPTNKMRKSTEIDDVLQNKLLDEVVARNHGSPWKSAREKARKALT